MQESYYNYIKRMDRMTDMSQDGLSNHIIALKNKHHDLDKRIEALIAEHAPDQYVTTMKKEKLALKEQIVDCEKRLEDLKISE